MSDLEKLASDLEHFAQVLHTQVRRGYQPENAEDFAFLAGAVRLLDRVSLELCEAQEADEERQDTEDYIGKLLDTEGLKASLKSLSLYTR